MISGSRALVLGVVFLFSLPSAVFQANGRLEEQQPDIIVIDAEDEGIVVTEDGIFFPTGPIEPDTVVVLPELSEVPGSTQFLGEEVLLLESVNTVEPMSCTGTQSFAALPGGKFYGPWQSKCAIWGSGPDTRVPYGWQVTPGTNQYAAAQGMGYYYGYNGGSMGYWSRWYGLGAGTEGGTTVPWGNNSGYRYFKAASGNIHVATGRWW